MSESIYESKPEDLSEQSETRQYVIFAMREERFAVAMESVQEIIRVPNVVTVPLAPAAIMGVSNLRGRVLPIIELGKVFKSIPKSGDDAMRVLVIGHKGSSLGFMIDRVYKVVSIHPDQLEQNSTLSDNLDKAFLQGIIKDKSGNGMFQVVNFSALIESEFQSISEQFAQKGQANHSGNLNLEAQAVSDVEEDDHLISFIVEGQEYAIAINRAKEIVQMPDAFSVVPNSPHHLLGVITLRDRLLPLVSLRAMFGMSDQEFSEHNRVVVIPLQAGKARADGPAVGLVVDEMREVLRVPKDKIDSMPAALANDQSMQEISNICRLDEGRRLVSVISPEKLLANHLMVMAAETYGELNDQEQDLESQAQDEKEIMEDNQLVVFRLQKEEYGAPIHLVKEIVRVPEKMTDIPGAPDIFEGVINLRGSVLPVVDMRRRFGLSSDKRNDRQRIMVFEVHQRRVGFIVDSVTEVLRISNQGIEQAPSLSSEQADVIAGIVNLESLNRMILLLEVDGLLSRQQVETTELA